MTTLEQRIQAVCGHCGRDRRERRVMFAMKPGNDNEPWWLCSRCWIEGAAPPEKKTEQPPEDAPAEPARAAPTPPAAAAPAPESKRRRK